MFTTSRCKAVQGRKAKKQTSIEVVCHSLAAVGSAWVCSRLNPPESAANPLQRPPFLSSKQAARFEATAGPRPGELCSIEDVRPGSRQSPNHQPCVRLAFDSLRSRFQLVSPPTLGSAACMPVCHMIPLIVYQGPGKGVHTAELMRDIGSLDPFRGVIFGEVASP